MGAIPASTSVTNNTAAVARPGLYHSRSANPVLGRANAQTKKATVAANISHIGHFPGLVGSALLALRHLPAYIAHTVAGVNARKTQNHTHAPGGACVC